jgi:drug/metabolite transporter (DMT)-like permease
MARDRHYGVGLALVSAAALAWSSAGYFTRLIPTDAWTTCFWRGIFGGLFISLFAVVWLRQRLWAAIRSLGWPGWLITLNNAVGMTSFIISLKLTSVADVSIIYATLPFFAAGLGWLWVRERVSASTILASAVAAAGVAVMVSGTTLSGHLDGDALALLQTVSMAVGIVAIRRYRHISLLVAAAISNFLAALVAWPFAEPLAVGGADIGHLALFGFVQMTLGLTFFTVGSRLIPAAETALISALEAPLAPVWVWLAFGERPTNATIAGGVLVMAAALGHILAENRRIGRPRAALTTAPDTGLVVPAKAPWQKRGEEDGAKGDGTLRAARSPGAGASAADRLSR